MAELLWGIIGETFGVFRIHPRSIVEEFLHKRVEKFHKKLSEKFLVEYSDQYVKYFFFIKVMQWMEFLDESLEKRIFFETPPWKHWNFLELIWTYFRNIWKNSRRKFSRDLCRNLEKSSMEVSMLNKARFFRAIFGEVIGYFSAIIPEIVF